MRIKDFILFCFLINSTLISAQKGIEIMVSGKKVEAGEPLMIRYSLSNYNERDMMRRSFEPFELLANPQIGRSMSTTFINGNMTSSQTNSYTIYVACKKLGKQIVPKQAFQLSDGTIIETQAIEIEVVKPGTLPKPPPQQRQPNPFDPYSMFDDQNDPFGPPPSMGRQAPQQNQNAPSGVYKDEKDIVLSKDIFARIHVNKNRVYVGEPVQASIKIYTSLNSKGFEAEKVPNFNGFWTQDIPLPEKLEMKREMINGKEFVSVEIKKILLFPTKAGTLEITPLKMKTIALVPIMKQRQNNPRQPRSLMEEILASMGMTMNSMGVEFKEIPYSFSSGSERINVLPLPENAPASFTGGVGKFSFNAYADKKTLKTDEALNYRVELTGSGNLPLIQAPKNIWDENIEVYDPNIKENYSSQPTFSGTKTWSFVAIPHAPGSYTTPNLEFSYFDLEQKKYVVLTAPATALTITGKPTSAKEKGKKYGEFNYAKQKIRESKLYTSKSEISNGIFYGLGIVPLLLAFGLGFLPKYEQKKERFISGKKISERVMLQMKQAEMYLNENNKESFYQELTRTYWNYLSHKLRLETSDLSRSNIVEKLKDKGVSYDMIAKMIDLIDNSEMGLYTAYGSQSMKEIYDNSLVVLNDLDSQIV
jgi:hypothetical protein